MAMYPSWSFKTYNMDNGFSGRDSCRKQPIAWWSDNRSRSLIGLTTIVLWRGVKNLKNKRASRKIIQHPPASLDHISKHLISLW